MPTKEELLERAKELDVEGRSTMSKDELATAVSEAEKKEGQVDTTDPDHVPEGRVGLAGKDESVPDDEKGAVARGDAIAVDEEKAEELKERTVTPEESEEKEQERLDTVEEEAGPETRELVTEELDTQGPLHVQPPSERTMVGAVNEEQAEEQDKILRDKPDEDYNPTHVTEAGYHVSKRPKTTYYFANGEYDEDVANEAEQERYKLDGVDTRPLGDQLANRQDQLTAVKQRDKNEGRNGRTLSTEE